jgi:hypothetical protein
LLRLDGFGIFALRLYPRTWALNLGAAA